MKRGFEIFFAILVCILVFTLMITFSSWLDSGISEAEEKNKVKEQENKILRLDCEYELVALEVNEQTVLNGEISSIYLLCSGGTSGNIKPSTEITYSYWYRREDGGMIRNTIDMSQYEQLKNVTVVIYENDNATPKVEFWRNYNAREIDDGVYGAKTEIRFTVPTGSVVDANLQRTDVNITEVKE